MEKEVFIVSALRTPIGEFGGALKSIDPLDLAVSVMKAAIDQSGIPKDRIGKVILGNTLAPLKPNIARGAAITCGIPPEVPSFSVHCACASAMQAIISGASALMLGEGETALVGGVNPNS